MAAKGFSIEYFFLQFQKKYKKIVLLNAVKAFCTGLREIPIITN